MKIPRELQIPAIVFTLEAVFILGLSMIFLVLVPRSLISERCCIRRLARYRTAPRLRCG